MSIFHFDPVAGTPVACTVKSGKCFLGSDSEHYTSGESAWVANTGNIGPERLAELNALIASEDPWVRSKAARCEDTPVRLLQALAYDESRIVREAVAENKTTPSGVLRLLSFNSSWSVREAVAANVNTSDETLLRLAEDSDEDVRFTVSKNPHRAS